MAFITFFKSPMALLIHLLSYVLFILSIIQITKQKDMYGQRVDNYVAPVIALLVVGALQMIYHLGYWILNARPAYSIGKMLLALTFFGAFNLGAIIALTVQRHDFCGQVITGGAYVTGAKYEWFDCQGVIRAEMGMGWALFGMDLFYIIYLLILSRYAQNGMAEPVGTAGEAIKPNPDEEKAPVH